MSNVKRVSIHFIYNPYKFPRTPEYKSVMFHIGDIVTNPYYGLRVYTNKITGTKYSDYNVGVFITGDEAVNDGFLRQFVEDIKTFAKVLEAEYTDLEAGGHVLLPLS